MHTVPSSPTPGAAMSAASRQQLLPGRWEAVLSTSRASFTARDVLHRPVHGTLPLRAASVDVGPDGLPVAVRAELDTAGVDTGHARRDRDLRGRRFLAVDEQPVLLFRGGPAVPDGDGWALAGELLLGAASCPVSLRVLRTSGTSVRATATFDRRNLGIGVPRLLVGTAVAVTVDAELVPPTP